MEISRDFPLANAPRWQGENWTKFVADLKKKNILLEQSKAKRSIFVSDAGGLAYGLPCGVLRAQSALQISKLLKAAQKYKVPVTVRGGGLTTEGESVAFGGVLLDMTGMSKVRHIDSQN